MSYHHLNRFKAHNCFELSAAERLLAWHFASESRGSNNYFSQSLRRLKEELDLDPRTISRALGRLVDLGLFERFDRTGTYAPIYRLKLSCPLNCEDLEAHNSKQELEARKVLPPTNTPTLTRNHAHPYIDKREEEEGFVFEEVLAGGLELTFIKEALEQLGTLTEDHLTLKGFLELNPWGIAEAALELTEGVSQKGLKNYLAQIVIKTPQNLTARLEGLQKASEGSKRLKDTPKPTSTYEPAATASRVASYAWEVIEGFEPRSSFSYLQAVALKGELTGEQVFLAEKLEQVLAAGNDWLPEAEIKIKLNSEGQIYLQGHLEGFMGDLIELHTPQEAEALKTRTEGLEQLREIWQLENLGEFSEVKFWQVSRHIDFHLANPEPLTQEEKTRRLLEYLAKELRECSNQFLETFEGYDGDNFQNWLIKNYSAEEDLKEFLEHFPQRSEDPDHREDFRKALPDFMKARKFLTLEELQFKAGAYRERLGSTYAQKASNWLSNEVAELKGIKIYF